MTRLPARTCAAGNALTSRASRLWHSYRVPRLKFLLALSVLRGNSPPSKAPPIGYLLDAHTGMPGAMLFGLASFRHFSILMKRRKYANSLKSDCVGSLRLCPGVG